MPSKARLALLHTLLDAHDIPPGHLYPGHCNRSEALLDDASALAKRKAYVDIDSTEGGWPAGCAITGRTAARPSG